MATLAARRTPAASRLPLDASWFRVCRRACPSIEPAHRFQTRIGTDMRSVLDRISQGLLRTAARLLSPRRAAWACAIQAEFDAVPNRLDRFRFSAGCLAFALVVWAQTGAGFVRLGRLTIATALWALSAMGLYVAAGLSGGASVLLVSACSGYILIGLIALISLPALRAAAVLSFLLTGAAALVLSADAAGAGSFQTMLMVEAGALMVALSIIATVLLRVSRGRARDA